MRQKWFDSSDELDDWILRGSSIVSCLAQKPNALAAWLGENARDAAFMDNAANGIKLLYPSWNQALDLAWKTGMWLPEQEDDWLFWISVFHSSISRDNLQEVSILKYISHGGEVCCRALTEFACAVARYDNKNNELEKNITALLQHQQFWPDEQTIREWVRVKTYAAQVLARVVPMWQERLSAAKQSYEQMGGKTILGSQVECLVRALSTAGHRQTYELELPANVT